MSKCYHSRSFDDAFTEKTWICKKCKKRVGFTKRKLMYCVLILWGFTLLKLYDDFFDATEDAIFAAIGKWPGRIAIIIAGAAFLYFTFFLIVRLAPVREMPEPVEEKAEPEEKDER